MTDKLSRSSDNRRRDARSAGVVPSRRLLTYALDRHGDVVDVDGLDDSTGANVRLADRWLARSVS